MRQPRTFLIMEATLPMKVRPSHAGGFIADFPAIPGATAKGETYDQAILNLAKVIQTALEPA